MKQTKQQNKQSHYQRVLDYISQNLDQPFNLDELSSIAGFSKFHFNRQFSALTGVSVFRFIQLMRLKRASYQLVFNRETKIIDIALDAQFENPESFSRAFKQSFGQTPSQFRKQPEWTLWQAKFGEPSTLALSTHQQDTPMQVDIIPFETTKLAIKRHRGSPSEVMVSAGQFIEWRKQTNYSPVNQSRTFGIAYDDPATTKPKDFRFDIGGEISTDVPQNSYGIINSEIPGGQCAVIRHLGSHDKMDDKIRYLYAEWLPKSDYQLREFPCFFHYLNLIPFVEEHELTTNIYLPII